MLPYQLDTPPNVVSISVRDAPTPSVVYSTDERGGATVTADLPGESPVVSKCTCAWYSLACGCGRSARPDYGSLKRAGYGSGAPIPYPRTASLPRKLLKEAAAKRVVVVFDL